MITMLVFLIKVVDIGYSFFNRISKIMELVDDISVSLVATTMEKEVVERNLLKVVGSKFGLRVL